MINKGRINLRREQVPVDMASEQKVILGIISMRQLIYVIIGGTFIYTIFPVVWGILGDLPLTVKLIVEIIVNMPIVAIIGYFGFLKNGKYNMFFDYYWLVRLGEKSQYGIWRKGRKTGHRGNI